MKYVLVWYPFGPTKPMIASTGIDDWVGVHRQVLFNEIREFDSPMAAEEYKKTVIYPAFTADDVKVLKIHIETVDWLKRLVIADALK